MFLNNLTATSQAKIGSPSKRSNEPSKIQIANQLSSNQSFQTLDDDRSRLDSMPQAFHRMDTGDEAYNKREMIEGLKRTFIIVDDPKNHRDSLYSGSSKSLRTHNSFHTKSFAKFGNSFPKNKTNSFFYTSRPSKPKASLPNEYSLINSSTLRNTQMPTLDKDQFLFLREKLKAPLLYQKNFEDFPRGKNHSQSRISGASPQPPRIDSRKPNSDRGQKKGKISANLKKIVYQKNDLKNSSLMVGSRGGSNQDTSRNASKITAMGGKGSPTKNSVIKAVGPKFFNPAQGIERISEGSKNSSFMEHDSYNSYLDIDEGLKKPLRVIGPEDPWTRTMGDWGVTKHKTSIEDKSFEFRKFMDKVEGNQELNRRFGRPDPEARSGYDVDTTE